MNSQDDSLKDFGNLSASEWVVALDSDTVDEATHDAFIKWLHSNPQNHADYARCEAALAVTQELRHDPDLEWAFDEAAALAAGKNAPVRRRSPTRWLTQRRYGIGLAGLAIVGFIVSLVILSDDSVTNIPVLSSDQMANTLAPPEDEFGPEIVEVPVPQLPAQQPEVAPIVADASAAEEARPAVTDSGSLEERIREAQSRVDQLLQIFAETHPDVVAARQVLDELSGRQATSLDELIAAMQTNGQQRDSSVEVRSGNASTTDQDVPVTESVAAIDAEYLIGPGDRLYVFVWQEEELSVDVAVRPDGRISMPLIEDLVAVGKTPSQLAKDIESVLSEFIRSPQVSIFADDFQGTPASQIRVLGEVANPGSYPYRDGMTLLDVLVEAGGLTEFAAGRRGRIGRIVNGEAQEMRVRMDLLMERGDLTQNRPLAAGDVIVVPASIF